MWYANGNNIQMTDDEGKVLKIVNGVPTWA